MTATKAFVSYSHSNAEHEDWVLRLAVNGNRKLLIFGNRKLHTSEKGAGTGVTPFGWFRRGERGWTEGA